MADQPDENGTPAPGQAGAVDEPGPADQSFSVVPGLSTVQLALYAGWTMAVLWGGIPGGPSGRPAELPTVNELPAPARRNLEVIRLRHLLAGLLPGFAGMEKLSHLDTSDAEGSAELRSGQLELLNVAILNALTGKTAQVQLAYELGRSLRDTANPSVAPPAGDHAAEDPMLYELAHGRIAKLQEWLGTLSAALPDKTAAVVAASLGRWSYFATMAFGTKDAAKPSPSRLQRTRDETAVAASMRSYLLSQGDVWLMLLTGEQATDGLLTPEGYVAAGEAALHRSGVIVRGVVRHYCALLLGIAAALGGVLYLAVTYLGGAGKVWTSIAAIAGSLGVSGQTIASKTSRLASEAAKPVLTMSEEDAMAWAITSLPAARFTFRGVRKLRRAGVPPTATLGRF